MNGKIIKFYEKMKKEMSYLGGFISSTYSLCFMEKNLNPPPKELNSMEIKSNRTFTKLLISFSNISQ